jgi:hypothetical protein
LSVIIGRVNVLSNKLRKSIRISGFTLIPIILISSFFSVPLISTNNHAYSFKSGVEVDVGSKSWHMGKPIHEEITSTALSFLKADIVHHIMRANEMMDLNPLYSFPRKYHFDGCDFRQSVKYINEEFSVAVKLLNPAAFKSGDASNAFGSLLHVVQDFYSHSNWVDLGGRDLVDEGNGFWADFRPFTKVKGIYLVQGESVPNQFTLNREGKVVTVTDRATGKNTAGIISGSTYLSDDCPDKIALGHWDPHYIFGKKVDIGQWPTGIGSQNKGEGLNKDQQDRPGFSLAKTLSIKQTVHEWCRLVSLVDNAYSMEGVDYLVGAWVSNYDKAIAACSTSVQPAKETNMPIIVSPPEGATEVTPIKPPKSSSNTSTSSLQSNSPARGGLP